MLIDMTSCAIDFVYERQLIDNMPFTKITNITNSGENAYTTHLTNKGRDS